MENIFCSIVCLTFWNCLGPLRLNVGIMQLRPLRGCQALWMPPSSGWEKLGAWFSMILQTYRIIYRSLLLSKEYIESSRNCCQYDNCCTPAILRMKLLCTCSKFWMSPFWVGLHSWQQYSSLGRISDLHSISIGILCRVLKVRSTYPQSWLAVLVTLLICFLKVPLLLIVIPRSLALSTILIGSPVGVV